MYMNIRLTNEIVVETYGVFNTVPAKPPDTKLFISCALEK